MEGARRHADLWMRCEHERMTHGVSAEDARRKRGHVRRGTASKGLPVGKVTE